MLKLIKYLIKIYKLKKLDSKGNLDYRISSHLRIDAEGNLRIELEFYSRINLLKRKPRLSKKEKNLLKELDRIYLP
jgi:hypothetical protein